MGSQTFIQTQFCDFLSNQSLITSVGRVGGFEVCDGANAVDTRACSEDAAELLLLPQAWGEMGRVWSEDPREPVPGDRCQPEHGAPGPVTLAPHSWWAWGRGPVVSLQRGFTSQTQRYIGTFRFFSIC